jgi:hypothetical protein
MGIKIYDKNSDTRVRRNREINNYRDFHIFLSIIDSTNRKSVRVLKTWTMLSSNLINLKEKNLHFSDWDNGIKYINKYMCTLLIKEKLKNHYLI